MGRNAQEQIKKDGALGYITRAASAPLTLAVGLGESIVRGDLKAPVANKISNTAANLGKSAEKAIANHVTKHPVQSAAQATSALLVNQAIKKVTERVDRLESNQKNK
jgi:hypothetical protein